MRTRLEPEAKRPSVRGGFTLVELIVVIVIIGIIIAFLLNAAMDSVRRAEERATQSLITKLDNALNDRLDALLQTRPDPDGTHLQLGGIYSSAYASPVAGLQRASVIAAYDYIKRELPDVFYVQDLGVYNNPPTVTTNYPLNFAASRFGSTGTDADFWLPLGSGTTGEGIYGASYFAAAGIYKNLGYPPQAYDGTDSDADGFVDNFTEVVKYASAQQVSAIEANLAAHKHNTARSEMLYALLVEGSGPLGSVFSKDDFTDKEVQDTDNDGLPEFVDAWGQPLQFYRWPLLYHSDIQRGQVIVATSEQAQALAQPYSYPWEEREQDPLDENQQLVAPGWWFGVSASGLPVNDTSQLTVPINPSSAVNASWAVQAFEYYFHRLSEPYYITTSSQAWDRSGYYRRAFYSKFLIVSSGPDKLLGLFQYNDTALHGLSNPAAGLIFNENNAMPFVFDFTGSAYAPQGSSIAGPSSGDDTNPNSYDLQQNGKDDIANQTLQITAGGP